MVVGAGDRARARTREVGGVGPDLQEHVGGVVTTPPIAMVRGKAEETVKALDSVVSGVSLLTGERTRGREEASVHTASVVH